MTEDAEKKAKKHGLAMGTAFGGLLLFDVFCVQASTICFGSPPFRRAAEFAERLPFATLHGKHAAAERYFRSTDAAIICVQDGRKLNDFDAVASRYQFFRARRNE